MEYSIYIVGGAFLVAWGLWWGAQRLMHFSYEAGIEANDEVVVLFVEHNDGWYNVRDHEDHFILGGDDIRELAERASNRFTECRKLMFVMVSDGYIDDVNKRIEVAGQGSDGVPKAVMFMTPISIEPKGDEDDAI